MHVIKTDILFHVKQDDIRIIYTSYDISHDMKHNELQRAKHSLPSVDKKASMKDILALEVTKY